MPDDVANETQFEVIKGHGTAVALSLATDLVKYIDNNDSPVYICSLDAHKCFDSIVHDGLFYKLIISMSVLHWTFQYKHKWYRLSKAQFRWPRKMLSLFSISKGMQQGSILSHHIIQYLYFKIIFYYYSSLKIMA